MLSGHPEVLPQLVQKRATLGGEAGPLERRGCDGRAAIVQFFVETTDYQDTRSFRVARSQKRNLAASFLRGAWFHQVCRLFINGQ